MRTTFLQALPLERTCYVHVAGHYVEPDGLVIDTHGAEVIDPVWALLAAAYERTGGEVPDLPGARLQPARTAGAGRRGGADCAPAGGSAPAGEKGRVMQATAPHSFQAFQHAFARHLRDPHHTPRPAGVPARRMAVYNELLFNNVCGFLDSCFPVSRRVLGEARWRRLGRSFYRDWPLHSPLYREIPREFVRYLQQTDGLRLPAWLPELAHYEWAELAVDVMEVACAAAPAGRRPDAAAGATQPGAAEPGLRLAGAPHRPRVPPAPAAAHAPAGLPRCG